MLPCDTKDFMSDRPIQVGDLVMVVKPSGCGCGHSVGIPFIVQKIDTRKLRCLYCGKQHGIVSGAQDVDAYWVQTNRLKLIDPPAESDSLPTRRELEETA